MRRYYVEETGILHGRSIGVIYNRDGSVYNGGMNKEPAETVIDTTDIKLLAYDDVDVSLDGNLDDQTVDLIFTQKVKGSQSTAAAIRFGSAKQLEEFLEEVCSRVIGFKNKHDGSFPYEITRQSNAYHPLSERFFNPSKKNEK